MATEGMRELAVQYPGLLTVECEAQGACFWPDRFDKTDVIHRVGDSWCRTCAGTGRRLKTLEELLAIDRMMLWYEHGWCAESDDEKVERHGFDTPWEAAARLLIELEASRGH